MNYRAPIYRICIVTREKLLKEDMFRVVRTGQGVYFDKYQNMPGRGVYIKKDLQVILKAQKSRALSRGLRCEVKDEIYIELIQALNKKEGK